MRDRKNSALRDVRSLGAMNLTLMLQRDRADARVKALKGALELLAKDKKGLVFQAEWSKIKTRTEGHGRPYTDEFEAFAVKCMSTGISAQQCREQMLLNADFHEAGDGFVVPEVDWFDRLRERIGNESLLYAFVKAARAKEAPQFGSDETAIHRQGTYNQWVRIENDEGQIEVVYIETSDRRVPCWCYCRRSFGTYREDMGAGAVLHRCTSRRTRRRC